MSSVSKVGEIFSAAGEAFSRLGELTMQLHPMAEPSPTSGKWTDEEIEMLRSSIKTFGDDLQKISETIKTRTVSQIRTAMKKKAQEQAAAHKQDAERKAQMNSRQEENSTAPSGDEPPLKKQKQSEVTLNMLNSTETPGDSLVDIEGLEETPMKKLEFGLSSNTDQDLNLDSNLMGSGSDIESLQR
ncbi:chromatin complexes subunit BAP18-like isoform X2 [Acanthaster planci]|uniref:Chromatin complexes subunit BAP18-like isoform X2 n=1 Tax=Acanthaster planci TaxID=133434 RepID=A0A8B7YRQ6_ACAPL|nr:chromatin complexes subunit BAP18-like isoform X2 [Acanthaster planci]